jgi:hypothetical protein
MQPFAQVVTVPGNANDTSYGGTAGLRFRSCTGVGDRSCAIQGP